MAVGYAIGLSLLAVAAASSVAVVQSPRASEAPSYLSLPQLDARYRLPNSRFVTLSGHRIHYTDEGKGPVIVLLHGSSGSLRTFDGMVGRLSRDHRVIRFDESNMGLSGPPPQALYTRPLYPVIVLEELLAHLKVRSATFVGVSSGGAIAFYFAARHPDMVERLILSNTPHGRADGAGMTLSRDLARELAASTPATGRQSKIYRPRSYWKAFFDFYTGEPERIRPAQIDQYYDMNRRVPAPDALAIVTALNDADATTGDLARITAPTLLIWGARDPILPPRTAQELAAGLTHAQVSTVLMPDVGHYPPLEVPDRFATLVESFIKAATPVKPKAPPPSER